VVKSKMSDPTVVISLDLELSWGMFDLSFDDHLAEDGPVDPRRRAPNLLITSQATAYRQLGPRLVR